MQFLFLFFICFYVHAMLVEFASLVFFHPVLTVLDTPSSFDVFTIVLR